MAQCGLPHGQVVLGTAGLVGRSLAELGGGLKGGLYPAGPVGVAFCDGPRQRPRCLAEPVLQVSPGPPDLTLDQIRGLVEDVLARGASAELAGQPTPDRAG